MNFSLQFNTKLQLVWVKIMTTGLEFTNSNSIYCYRQIFSLGEQVAGCKYS